MHPSHKTRFSDSSAYDEVCVNCGVTDAAWDTNKAKERCPALNKSRPARPSCPACGVELFKVLYTPNNVFSEDEFNAIKAGDYYCTVCKSSETLSGFKYWWEREVCR